MKQKKFKFSLGFKIATILSCLALVSTGFASWWIVSIRNDNNGRQEGSFTVYAVEEKEVEVTIDSWTNPSTIDRSAYSKLGQKASAGCIRMTVRDAKWIYENLERGTYVISTNAAMPEGLPGSEGVPPMTMNVRWDPTDPDERNPYLAQEEDAAVPMPTPRPAN